MATVPMSNARREDIQQHIKAMAEADRKQEIPDFVKTSDLDGGRLITLLQWWPVKPDAIDAVPRDWLDEAQSTIQVLPREPQMVRSYSHSPLVPESLEPVFTVEYPNATDAWARPHTGYQAPKTQISLQRIAVVAAAYPGIPGLSELARNAELWPAVKAHQAKWAKIEDQLMGLLKAAKSLNGAVKAFPNLPFYLPNDMVTALRAQTVAKERVELDTSGLDLETLTTVGVTAALSQRKE